MRLEIHTMPQPNEFGTCIEHFYISNRHALQILANRGPVSGFGDERNLSLHIQRRISQRQINGHLEGE